MTIYVKLDDVVAFFKDGGSLKADVGLNIITRIKPGHGSCCTCQICGRHYDECVCDHNDLVTWIEGLDKLELNEEK